ncbi:hypothetical protein C8R44DRAFT_888082 [Mycena epipterygia]|nr:hypothetical protein C8R44DRAFT_888082 [Mycena epipterygia]
MRRRLPPRPNSIEAFALHSSAGNAEANAVFVDPFSADLTPVDATSLGNVSTMFDAAVDAKGTSSPQSFLIDIYPSSPALQVIKIKNKVLEFTNEVQRIKLRVCFPPHRSRPYHSRLRALALTPRGPINRAFYPFFSHLPFIAQSAAGSTSEGDEGCDGRKDHHCRRRKTAPATAGTEPATAAAIAASKRTFPFALQHNRQLQISDGVECGGGGAYGVCESHVLSRPFFFSSSACGVPFERLALLSFSAPSLAALALLRVTPCSSACHSFPATPRVPLPSLRARARCLFLPSARGLSLLPPSLPPSSPLLPAPRSLSFYPHRSLPGRPDHRRCDLDREHWHDYVLFFSSFSARHRPPWPVDAVLPPSCFHAAPGCVVTTYPPFQVSSTSPPPPSSFALPPGSSIAFTSCRVPHPRSPPPIASSPLFPSRRRPSPPHSSTSDASRVCSAARRKSQRLVTSFPSLTLLPLAFTSCPSLHAPPRSPHSGLSPSPRPIGAFSRPSPSLPHHSVVTYCAVPLCHSHVPASHPFVSSHVLPSPSLRHLSRVVLHHFTYPSSTLPPPLPLPLLAFASSSPVGFALISLLFVAAAHQVDKIKNKILKLTGEVQHRGHGHAESGGELGDYANQVRKRYGT